MLAALVLVSPGEPPRLYLIPATAWGEPNALFVDRDDEGLKSKPEWGLNLSRRNLPLLAPYAFEQAVGAL